MPPLEASPEFVTYFLQGWSGVYAVWIVIGLVFDRAFALPRYSRTPPLPAQHGPTTSALPEYSRAATDSPPTREPMPTGPASPVAESAAGDPALLARLPERLGRHVVALDHGHWSGKRQIRVDGELAHESQVVFDLGRREHRFQIGPIDFAVVVSTNGATYGYDLVVGGRARGRLTELAPVTARDGRGDEVIPAAGTPEAASPEPGLVAAPVEAIAVPHRVVTIRSRTAPACRSWLHS